MTYKTIKPINKTFFYIFSILVLIMINYRGVTVDKTLGKLTDCLGCYKYWIISVDSRVAIFAFVILLFGFFSKTYLIRTSARLIFVIYLIYSLVDIYLYKFLNQRLMFSDIWIYFNFDLIIETLNKNNKVISIIILLISFISIFFFVFKHQQSTFQNIDKFFSGILFLTLLVMVFFVKRIDYINDVTIRNIVEINLKSTLDVQYSLEKEKEIIDQIGRYEATSCSQKEIVNQPNVILVVWESLSMYQSKLFSGLNNWTPNLDKIALDNRYYTNFFANNFTSLEGRLALLTGEKTFRDIAAMTKERGRVGYWNLERSVPQIFNENGYHTAFLDGASLKFTNTGEFMRNLGFDYVEGQSYKGYKGFPRFGFRSVADNVLYDRVIDYINSQKQKYFITIITVSTHAPYIDPVTKQKSIEKTTRFADKSLYEFYLKLEQENFFEDGILVITSDHRSMTPVSKQELEKFGREAVSRIPLVVVDRKAVSSQISEQYLQQSDFLNSFEYLISEQYCKRNGEGNIFSEPAMPTECIYHSRGDFRDEIDVYCDNGKESAIIKLDGDNTKVIDGKLNKENEIIDYINASRISARKRHEEYLRMQTK
ncbi:MAG TPA: LTA synthase family protein [Gammaproteobacteria bacterium]|nr:LTA synthase family protein [Gammaproteobacteria bacterium]